MDVVTWRMLLGKITESNQTRIVVAVSGGGGRGDVDVGVGVEAAVYMCRCGCGSIRGCRGGSGLMITNMKISHQFCSLFIIFSFLFFSTFHRLYFF